MFTPVISVSLAGLKYEALLAVRVAVAYSFSGNLSTLLLTQVGMSTANTMRHVPSPARTSPTRRIDPPVKRLAAWAGGTQKLPGSIMGEL
jgi:hypothetical protein